ncbi:MULTISPECIES: hypothetical protein [unclassified Amycolatopsis]|uniref:hypothetical protein n=1 Tax=unclassified Amycolatopsis TaxID=2618356 RepID=UPI00287607BF|nr:MULTISPECIES: hypothetical protein [unclassified Amycolatopsis]MDS0137311.1 hypothetical protein [Amycolatopsis sp. 505]MDS0141506.1 hypothetical protein [Amycolatopsis sp. CM201R]
MQLADVLGPEQPAPAAGAGHRQAFARGQPVEAMLARPALVVKSNPATPVRRVSAAANSPKEVVRSTTARAIRIALPSSIIFCHSATSRPDQPATAPFPRAGMK